MNGAKEASGKVWVKVRGQLAQLSRLGSVGAAMAASTLASASDSTSGPIWPIWKDATVGQVRYSSIKDQRTEVDRDYYQINPDGLITGENLLSLIRPMNRSLFDQIMRRQGKTEDLDQLYSDYLQGMLDRGMAVIALNRVIDNEAMKRKLPLEVSDVRVNYVMRAVLVENAISIDKVPTKQVPIKDPSTGRIVRDQSGNPLTRSVPVKPLNSIPTQDLYEWLKERVGEESVHFTIQWNYTDGGMDADLRTIYTSSREFQWPQVRISFKKLPATALEFKQQIAEKLQPTHRVLLRQVVWRTLLDERNPFLNMRTLFSVDATELDRLYDVLKETRFKVQERTALVTDLVVSGAKAEAFKDRFNEVLKGRQEALLKELFSNEAGAAQPTAEQIRELRESVPREVFEQVKSSFEPALSSGELKLQFVDRSIYHNGKDALPADRSIEAQQVQTAFNPMFSVSALFPKLELKDQNGTIKILLFKNLNLGEFSYREKNDPLVDRFLRSQLQSKFQARVIRDLGYDLLSENPVSVVRDTCSDPVWPCLNPGAKRMTEMLFPERLYPGETLGTDESGAALTSTLGRFDMNGKVQDISLELFMKAFEIPNP